MSQAGAARAWVGLGANLGDPAATLRTALAELGTIPRTRLLAHSSIYVTRPVDASGPDYCNAVAALETGLPPLELLAQLQGIENAHGRERPHRNAPRTLDLDLLLYEGLVIDTRELTLPHPRMHQRAFVLAPLLEIDPATTLPGLGPASEFFDKVSQQSIRKLP